MGPRLEPAAGLCGREEGRGEDGAPCGRHVVEGGEHVAGAGEGRGVLTVRDGGGEGGGVDRVG